MTKTLEQYRVYNRTPRGLLKILRGNAKRRGIEYNIRTEDFISWFESQERVCFYCGSPIIVGNGAYRPKTLSIDRLDNSKGYSIENIKLACYRCNSFKSNDLPMEAMLEIGQILKRYRHLLRKDKLKEVI